MSKNLLTKKSSPSPGLGYEPQDASLRLVVATAVALLILVGSSLGISFWFYSRHYASTASLGPRQTSFKNGPEERTGISLDRAALQEEARIRLETYGWIDRPSGIVRLPITRAMELMADELNTSSANGSPP